MTDIMVQCAFLDADTADAAVKQVGVPLLKAYVLRLVGSVAGVSYDVDSARWSFIDLTVTSPNPFTPPLAAAPANAGT